MPKQEKEEKMTEFPLSASRLFAFTIDADTAQIVKLETLDASGARHELSEEEKAGLARQGTEDLEQLVEQVFEAGIACVLGGGEREDKAEEPAEEAELRHMLLAPLIEHSPARRLIQREALSRAGSPRGPSFQSSTTAMTSSSTRKSRIASRVTSTSV